MLTLEPKTNAELYEEPNYLEFALPGEAELLDGADLVDAEREHLDDQIIAALVCP